MIRVQVVYDNYGLVSRTEVRVKRGGARSRVGGKGLDLMVISYDRIKNGTWNGNELSTDTMDGTPEMWLGVGGGSSLPDRG